MKTTLDLSDMLFLQAKEIAAQQGLTLRALMEEGLRYVIGERSKPQAKKPFVMQDFSVGGPEPLPNFDPSSWRDDDMAYREDKLMSGFKD